MEPNTTSDNNSVFNAQATLFDDLASKYEAHFGGTISQKFRNKFFYTPLFEGINLNGMHVLEAMCGSGQTTEYLLEKKAIVTGLDISEKQIDIFRHRWPECNAICSSFLDITENNNLFDCIVIVGGLHHMHPFVKQSINVVIKKLKVGGWFCFIEPHSRSFPNLIRKMWYRVDPYIEKNEAAIDITRLKQDFSEYFIFKKEIFTGNIGYLLIVNSMILRMPLCIKNIYAPLLMKIESIIAPFQSMSMSCYTIAQWQKKK